MADIENKNELGTESVPEKKEETVEQTAAPAANTVQTATETTAAEAEAPKAAEVSDQPKTAPETTAPKAEAPHVNVQPIHAEKAKKEKKVFPWKPVLQVAGVAVLSIGCGFGGGYLAGQQSAQNAISSAESSVQSENGFPGGMMRGNDSDSSDFSGKGSMPDNNSGSSTTTDTTGAALGIYVQTNTDNQVVIAGFSDNSTAQTAGLQTGDIITALDGTTVSSYNEITTFLASKSAGDQVKVTATRDGAEVNATITLVEKSAMSSSGSSSSNGSSSNGSSSDSTAPSMGRPDAQSGSTSNSASSSSSSGTLQG